MKGDFTRFTFKRENNYSSVRLQQGRVQMDADWNEQADIQNHLQRTGGTDVIGASGVPRLGGGFEVLVAERYTDSQDATGIESCIGDLAISPGRIYVDGILCENDEDRPSCGDEALTAAWFTRQPHYPGAQLPADGGLYLLYLDVWERHITAVEDPAIREIALGGPDTATRVKTLWQAKWLRVVDDNGHGTALTCWDTPMAADSPARTWLEAIDMPRAQMSARAAAAPGTQDPCIVPATAGYRRLENQLYRVEIHRGGGAAQATFKWSRDNGVVLSRLIAIDPVDKNLLTVAQPGKDAALGFDEGQWVEVTDQYRVLRNESGVLVRLANVEGAKLEIMGWPDDALPTLDLETATVRRWDQQDTDTEILADTDGALNVAVAMDTDAWFELEDGVQIQLDLPADAVFRTGDYWLVPARTVNADVEWPRDDSDPANPVPIPQPPRGIEHHYARLALVDVEEDSSTPLSVRHDCRPLFPALTEPDLYYISGDGQEAMPDTPLPQALRVGVSNCNRPIQGAWVMFKVREGSGKIQPKEILEGGVRIFPMVVLDLLGQPISPTQRVDGFIVPTDPHGQAYCIWHMQHLNQETDAFDQLVEATLLRAPEDRKEYKLDIPVVFGASLAVAWQDRYGDARFPGGSDAHPQHPELKVDNVEDALDQLRENVSMDYISGDGQQIMRRRGRRTEHSEAELLEMMDGDSIGPESLPEPLKVRVANGDWSFKNAKVRFQVEAGAGGLAETIDSQGPATLDVWTDDDGIATCYWTLDPANWSQQVSATLIALPGLEPTNPEDPRRDLPSLTETLYFNASLSVAEEVSYDGSDFPDDQHPSLEVLTAEAALDQLRENTALHYVGGDGQEAPRGARLPQPLTVRVANGQWPRAGAAVHFIADNGILEDEDGNPLSGDVITDAHGLARVYWRLDDAIDEGGDSIVSQRVTAILVDPTQLPVDPADYLNSARPSPGIIVFSGSLSIAAQVTYDGHHFPDEQHPSLVVSDVESALDQLRENLALYYVGGDGQEIVRRRGDGDYPQSLPQPLQVRVANGDWPFLRAKVTFKVTGGDGQLSLTPDSGGDEALTDVLTDADGIARCYWTLDPENWAQQVTAYLTGLPDVEDEDNPWPSITSDSRIVFNANLSIAEEVSYTSHEQSELDPPPNTVQGAIDELYEKKVNRSGDTITGSLIIEGDLTVNGDRFIANTIVQETEDNIVRVNKYSPQPQPRTAPNTAGLEVYRGQGNLPDGTGVTTPNAQIVWDEAEDHWKIGTEGALVDVAYGPNWDRLTEGDVVDDLHRHSKLYANNQNPIAAVNVDAAGNVGVGTTAPAARLHVNGNMLLKIGEGLELLGDNDYFGSSLDARVFRMRDVNGADGLVDGGIAIEGYTEKDQVRKAIMAVRGNGRVGIGTKQPKTLLHVYAPTPAARTYNWTTPTDFDQASVEPDPELFPVINRANRVTLTNNGGNGYLHVHPGSGSVQASIQLHNPADGGYWVTVWTRVFPESTVPGSLTEFYFNGLVIGFPEQDVDGIRIVSSVNQNQTFHAWGGMLFTFSYQQSAAFFDGLVGVKTATPVFDLDVNGMVNARNYYRNGLPIPWDAVSGGISYTSGSVGIGTLDLKDKLTVSGGSLRLQQTEGTLAAIRLDGAPAHTVPYIRTYNPDSAVNPYVWWSARDGSLMSVEGAAADGDSGTTYFRITSEGKVGIGTPTPGAGLVVSGNGLYESAIGIESTKAGMEWRLAVDTDQSFKIVKVSGNTFTPLQIDAAGVVSVGSAAQPGKVDVQGDVLISGGLQWKAVNTDWARIYFESTGDQPHASNLIFETYDNQDEGFIFRTSKVERARIDDRGLMVTGTLSATVKEFVIDHPDDPAASLVHASLEGPEAAVYYRGESQLVAGRALITLPRYFESLTRKPGRTVQLTAKGREPYLLSYTDIANGEFEVFGTKVDGRFAWEVKAVRADVAPVTVEVRKP